MTGWNLDHLKPNPNTVTGTIPQFFGVYALSLGQLTQLTPHRQSKTYQMTIAGGDVIQSLSGIHFHDSKDLSFIIFSPRIAEVTRYFVVEMATIRNMPQPAFHLQTKTGWPFRVAPVPNQPSMVQLVGPESGTAGGHLALITPDGFYDYEITGSAGTKDACVIREVSYMGPSYKPCSQ